MLYDRDDSDGSRLDIPHALAALVLPIGGADIEAACRHLIKARLSLFHFFWRKFVMNIEILIALFGLAVALLRLAAAGM